MLPHSGLESAPLALWPVTGSLNGEARPARSRRMASAERRRWQSLAQPLVCSSYCSSRSAAIAPADASGEAGSDSKRLTLRWRCSDQYLLRGSLGDPARVVRSGVPATLADGAAWFELAEPGPPACASDCFC